MLYALLGQLGLFEIFKVKLFAVHHSGCLIILYLLLKRQYYLPLKVVANSTNFQKCRYENGRLTPCNDRNINMFLVTVTAV